MNPDKLFDYLDGKLSPADRTQLEEKLMSDPQLRRQFNIARDIHRSGGGSREVVLPVDDDPEKARRSGIMVRRIGAAAVVLVFLNVAVGLGVIAFKNKKGDNMKSKEAEIREQLSASLGAAAQNAMPPPSFASEEIRITAARAEWENVASRVLAAATAFGGSAAKGLPEENTLTVMVDIPSSRDAEFRRVLTSAAAITPMPAVGPGQTSGGGASETSERTIVQVRIAEAAP